MTPTDPLYRDQWHFALIGDIETIWDEYDGTGVHVGVFDDGVEYTHPDLAANYDASMHFVFQGTTYDGLASDADEVHGTSVAGLIAAQNDNGTGGTGVAHGATITGINIFDPAANDTSDKEEAQIKWAQNFDIMSNSWGWTPGYENWQNLARPGAYLSQYDSWYAEVVANGRGGLGTVIVQAAGNDTLNATDAVNVSRYTLTIAATDETGNIADYSNFGPSILVAAPASAVTTDRLGNAGYNAGGSGDGDTFPRDYTSDFGGTSAATPTTSGVVALMLQANAGLGWRDVGNILAMSASLTGSAYGGAGTGFEVGGWGSGGTTTWNGGGSVYHLSYGYGMVDAFAAVRMAEAWLVMHDAAQTSANEAHVTDRSGAAVAIADNGSGAVSLDITDDINIETIYVTVEITHSHAGDLTIYLVAPDGNEIPVFLEEGGASLFDTGLKWTFAVEAARGYSSAGTWTVRVDDGSSGDTGTIDSVKLDFYGSEASNDDVYHFTDDFLTLQAVDAGRATVSDSNGGTDWLNMAAVAGNIVASLAAGGTVRVAGDLWFTQGAESAIENIFTGDGDDRIEGSTAANEIWSGRGDDRLRGAGGNDTLSGGQGVDTLAGGGGRDDFVFAAGFGDDTVLDFRNNRDTLVFDDALWGGGLSVSQVITTFGSEAALGVSFAFADGSSVLLEGFASLGQLYDDIDVI